MLYAIIAQDVVNSLDKRLKVRKLHLRRLNVLQDAGRLVLAGPFPLADNLATAGFSGSLIVAEFSSLERAQTWADADPYLLTGVYASVMVKPFKQVLA